MFQRFSEIMNFRWARLLLAAFVVFGAGGLFYFFISRSTFVGHHPVLTAIRTRLAAGHIPSAVSVKAPHRFGDPAKPTGLIRITAVYFVPNDLAPDPSVIPEIERVLSQLAAFHDTQFEGRSVIRQTILSEPLIGAQPQAYYEVSDNPQLSALERTTEKLNRISDELEARGMIPEYDMSEVYPVEYIFFEGVGLGGGIAIEESEFALGGAIVPVGLLTNPNIFFDDAFVAHEFYHTLAVPDGYDITNGHETIFTHDLMGAGRYRPLEATYLDEETLKAMGL